MIKPKNKKLRQFKEWLETHGAAVLPSTNEYELVRFKTRRGLSLIYVNKNDIITAVTGEADNAWSAFSCNRGWNGGLKTQREYRSQKKRGDVVQSLAQRDGWTCAYCGTLLNIETSTIEHVLPIARGGDDALKNMTLSCAVCNQEAGSMNIRQKIELAVKKRAA